MQVADLPEVVLVVVVAAVVARDNALLPEALSLPFEPTCAGETAGPTVEEADEEGGVVEVGVFG